jgi:hypothetical protein
MAGGPVYDDRNSENAMAMRVYFVCVWYVYLILTI